MELKKYRKKALALVLAACMAGTSTTPVIAAEDIFTDGPEISTEEFASEAAQAVQPKEVGYIQFSGEGMDTVYTEVKFGTAGPLMNFLGKVPEGKVFAGWKLNDKEVYAGGDNFTFDKALAKDLGTNAEGVHGYLFSFKATFEDAKVPVRKNIRKLSFKGVVEYYEYTGRRIRPTVTVKDGRKVLRAGKDYTITYSNNIKRGKASIVITGKGSYTGRKVITFRIVSKNLR